MDDGRIRRHIVATILERRSQQGPRRQEAISEVLSLAVSGLDDAATRNLASMAPELPKTLYEKWANLFADRLLETVERSQLAELCGGTEEHDATLALVYAMFMESERMEKIVTEDLRSLP